jgi:dihydrofolate synthase / folylpolyglutamate synthase
MNYAQTLEFLFSQLPMYQRIGKTAYKANLDNTYALDKYFGHPHLRFKTIHIAGTNGKGSVSHMLTSILMEAGYRVGLYTSPHLVDFRERIRVNGITISEEEVVEFVESYGQIFSEIKPSFFEMTVALAFKYFATQKVDIAVVEVGLGGRLDSTNIINPELSIITNIGLDHIDLLGDTLEKIAAEKAGIIKPNTPVVVSETQPVIDKIFENRAIESDSEITFADQVYSYQRNGYSKKHQKLSVNNCIAKKTTKYNLDLFGNYQAKNLLGVIAATKILKEKGYRINCNQIKSGLKKTVQNTSLLGRWQTLGHKPLIICDTGHNVDGIKQIVEQIGITPHKNLHMVIGMVGDKNIEGILRLLPKNAKYYFTKASIPRALDELKLAELALKQGLAGTTYPTVGDAVNSARKQAQESDLVFIGGSTFVVADALSNGF